MVEGSHVVDTFKEGEVPCGVDKGSHIVGMSKAMCYVDDGERSWENVDYVCLEVVDKLVGK